MAIRGPSPGPARGLAGTGSSATLDASRGVRRQERRRGTMAEIESAGSTAGDAGIDFALAAYREEGVWQLDELVHEVRGDVESLAHALRRFPGDGGAVGLVAVDEDFFLILRVAGATTRILLSDITAADEWELAA